MSPYGIHRFRRHHRENCCNFSASSFIRNVHNCQVYSSCQFRRVWIFTITRHRSLYYSTVNSWISARGAFSKIRRIRFVFILGRWLIKDKVNYSFSSLHYIEDQFTYNLKGTLIWGEVLIWRFTVCKSWKSALININLLRIVSIHHHEKRAWEFKTHHRQNVLDFQRVLLQERF